MPTNDFIKFANELRMLDLSEKIQKFAKDDILRKKIARKGKKKYMKYFNSTIVADYIIKNTFDIYYKKNSYMSVSYTHLTLPTILLV